MLEYCIIAKRANWETSGGFIEAPLNQAALIGLFSISQKRNKAAEGCDCEAYLIKKQQPYECIIKEAEANESISGVLMIPESCACMFSHKLCISSFPLTFLRRDQRRQRRRGCRETN